MTLELARHFNDAFYWVATSKPFAKMADRAAALIVADPKTAPEVLSYTTIIKNVATDLADRKLHHGKSVINFTVPYEAFEKSASPYDDAVATMTSLLDTCRDMNTAVSISKKIDGMGFYLIIDPSSPFQGLTWKKPALGLRADF